MEKSSWIKNYDEIASTEIRKDALSIIEAGLSAVETRKVISDILRFDATRRIIHIRDLSLNLEEYEHVYFLAVGKCAFEAATVVEEHIGHEITNGFVLDIVGGNFLKLKSFTGTHPLPSKQNQEATREIASFLSALSKKDLVLMVISGGGSALLCDPHDMSCEDFSLINSALIHAGATIQEINTVRKHLSSVQGGHLAKIMYPARVVGLIFSDVIGDDISMIASGPITKDQTTIEEARLVLQKYNIVNICSLPDCTLLETPKEDIYFENVTTFIVANNGIALRAMENEARRLGYNALIETTTLTGEAREVGREIARKAQTNYAILFGGETTVHVKHDNQGGRNQELALGALREVGGNSLVVSLATDGRDNGDVAGAIADSKSLQSAQQLGLSTEEYLERNDSYGFWKKVGSQIITGNTGINISDVMLVLMR